MVDYENEMCLPAGKTCADCYAVKFCVGVGSTKPDATKCDYYPNRFRFANRLPAKVEEKANA